MELLPLEILYKISDYLSLLDHYRLFSTCKSLHRRFFFYIGRRYPNNQEHFVLLINLNRHKELKYLLKARNIDINQNCFYMDEWDEFSPALSWAGHQGFEETLDLIMQDSRLSIVDDGSYCIVYASMNGHTSIVKKLLQNRDRAYDPGALNNYAIKYACQNGHFEIVRMLLEDSRVDPKGALLYSLDYGHLDITFMILNRGRLVPGELTESIAV
ncbi:hypothetical protein EDD86DRAFT_247801 [Gorgonomyces haynaldii]|nr:hypothetical protein EDD86DRAFT_247801 [Gorgonomyces haynaldii]